MLFRSPQMSRTARIERSTSESSVIVELDLDGRGQHEISTGVGFYDHMLTAFSRHSLIDLKVESKGDLHIDAHHTVEDTAICIGDALKEALGDKAGIRRYGNAIVPLDEAVAQCVVDISGRSYFVHTGEPERQITAIIGDRYIGSLTSHVFESIAHRAGITVHMNLLGGRDPHHIVEAQFKALARAVRMAIEPDPRETGVPSTKGAL